ncbi:MAG TPA: flavin reductase family protein [Gemmataceae bacterium]|jgi:flavin reductase (DIM6/NTAB) family NADH-FMN oxidoreductase RutF
MAFDSLAQRRIMGHFATGVTVVTAYQDGEICGMTANAVTSLSLNPPLILVAVDKTAAMHDTLTASGCFALNMLTREQEHLSRRFAMRGPKEVKDLTWSKAVSGAPILSDSLAWVDCRLAEILPGGDHSIFLGEILAGEARDGSPLLYFGGKYRRLAE